ncbi:MAG: YgiQ family radical SAM protein [Alloprevotella sp.]|nr:YgiQ family radical SAM protein [Alloprevotella sp.]
MYQLTDFLPTTKKEAALRGWDELDVVLFSGDAYVDHPSFGCAVLGRLLESAGYRVAIVPQPDWHGDFRDFRKMGRPRLFFGVSAGAMDSMVNKYTAARRLRSEDAYSPDGRHDRRPEYPSIVYSQILKQLYPDVPVVLGGIEASLRRVTHYDYWQDRLRPCILQESGADFIIYGMGELPILEAARRLAEGKPLSALRDLPQTVWLLKEADVPGGIAPDDIQLSSHETCLRDKRAYAANFRHVEEQSNMLHPCRLLQRMGSAYVVCNVPYPPMTTAQVDRSFDLPYTRVPHPKYRGHRIPAYEMIRHSICLHRGCFGGCAFCTISAHQGKFIQSRSLQSILREARQVTQMDDFKGYISDLGGPSANMYRMGGRDTTLCERCKRPSCIHPAVCRNLRADHQPLLDVYRAVDALPGVKKSFVGSGVRYDLLLHRSDHADENRAAQRYTEELICHHVSGRLKVAPEHTADATLSVMRKPPFEQFRAFKREFDNICSRHGLRQQIIPYFISSHPGCTEEDMAELAAATKRLDFHLEQVQDFTPTPMTVATEIFYSGLHPYTLQPLFVARTPEEKRRQRMFFFWYKPEERAAIVRELRRLGRDDLLQALYATPAPRQGHQPKPFLPKPNKPRHRRR